MSKYALRLKTEVDMIDHQFVRALLNDWFRHTDVRLQPDRYGLGEPVCEKISSGSVAEAVDLWSNGGTPLMMKRSRPPRFLADFRWHRVTPANAARGVGGSCSVGLESVAGDPLCEALFDFLVAHLDPAYAYVTTEDELRFRHFFSLQTPVGRVEKYVGMEVGETLPGVHWITYFGPWAVSKLGLGNEQGVHLSRRHCGMVAKPYGDSEMIGTPQAREAEQRIVEGLGSAHFFERSKFDPASLVPSPTAVRSIEAKLNARKES